MAVVESGDSGENEGEGVMTFAEEPAYIRAIQGRPTKNASEKTFSAIPRINSQSSRVEVFQSDLVKQSSKMKTMKKEGKVSKLLLSRFHAGKKS